MNGDDLEQTVGRGAGDGGEDRPEEEAPQVQEQGQEAPGLIRLVERRPEAAIVAICVLGLPYLIICLGMALMLANGLVGAGCGG